MSTLISVVLALTAAGGLAWLVRRLDAARMPRSTECSRIVDAVYVKAGPNAKDSDLLAELTLDRDRCAGDAIFVDQTRRLMTNLQQIDQARTLLEQADSSRAFKPDELAAQIAWVDVAESQQAWSNGDEARATELRDRAMASANRLREKWPEWSLPYRILGDANQSGASGLAYGEGTDYFQMERAVRAQKLNGAWIRSQSDWQPIVFTFVVAAIGFLAFAAGMDGFLDAREISGRPTSQIANATPGYVELKGTLHLLPGESAVIGSHTKQPGVWYELSSNSGMKKATTHIERSGQYFILRDATGEVVVDPKNISARTRHTTTRFGNAAGQLTGARVTENLLKENDSAFALGELSIATDATGTPVKYLRVAKDGRRMLVSNYSENELISMSKLWCATGLSICALSLALLAWSYFQRYHVSIAPGILS